MKVAYEYVNNDENAVRCNGQELIDSQVMQSEKLKSIGQLAAGIAHEINTPLQYINDNIYFLENAFNDIDQLLARYEMLARAIEGGYVTKRLIKDVGAAFTDSEVDYLRKEIPLAIGQTLEGLGHVSKIVRAMKEFSHPGLEEKIRVDINKAIQSTLTVSRNEWKYVSEIETDFDSELPLVPCLANEFNQVILNIIINAVDAIKDVVAEKPGSKGIIRIVTRQIPEGVEIRISDTGPGIREEIQSRVFDPFFTTKGVGCGTGQGLSIAYSVVVNKHGGTIRQQSEAGKGTTFIICLPVKDEPR